MWPILGHVGSGPPFHGPLPCRRLELQLGVPVEDNDPLLGLLLALSCQDGLCLVERVCVEHMHAAACVCISMCTHV